MRIDSDYDYQNFTNQGMSAADREKLNVGNIWLNAAMCNLCGDIIRSKNKHDFRTCHCGGTSVDGGSHYAKRLGSNYENIIEMFDDAETEVGE